MENEIQEVNEAGQEGLGNEGNSGVPPQSPAEKTVPLSALVNERRQAQGRIASLSARIQELEARTNPQPRSAGTQSEEDSHREQWWEKLKIKEPLSKIEAMEKRLEQLQAKAEMGEKAFTQVSAAANRAMNKVEKIVGSFFDKDLESIGYSKDEWDTIVAAQMTDDDVAECFADPNHAREVAQRVKAKLMPKINQNKSAIAAKIANLPRNPAPGGTPPAPPSPTPVKGKALHARAFERLQGRVSAEG